MKIKRGTVIAREDQNEIVLLKWRDARDVRMLSTMHAPEMVSKNEYAPGSNARVYTNATIDDIHIEEIQLSSTSSPATAEPHLQSKSGSADDNNNDESPQRSVDASGSFL